MIRTGASATQSTARTVVIESPTAGARKSKSPFLSPSKKENVIIPMIENKTSSPMLNNAVAIVPP